MKNYNTENNKNQKTLIKVSHITKIFNKGFLNNIISNPVTNIFPSVNDVSLDIKLGQTIGLVGASGSGKSTLGKMIVRLIRPTSGQIFYQENDIFSLSSKNFHPLRCDLQMVFQNPYSSFNNLLTVKEILSQGPQNFKKCGKNSENEFVDYLINLVGLNKDVKDKHPSELSGGECQRVGIARSLSVNPKFIVFDESTSAIDVIVQDKIIKTIKDIQKKRNLTYLFISHNIGLIKEISDNIAVMYNGKIVESGLPDKIYNNPNHEYTKKLITSFKYLSS